MGSCVFCGALELIETISRVLHCRQISRGHNSSCHDLLSQKILLLSGTEGLESVITEYEEQKLLEVEETLIECGIGKLTAHVNIAVNNEYYPAADRPISHRYSFFKCCNNWNHAKDDNVWIGRVTRCRFDTKLHE